MRHPKPNAGCLETESLKVLPTGLRILLFHNLYLPSNTLDAAKIRPLIPRKVMRKTTGTPFSSQVYILEELIKHQKEEKEIGKLFPFHRKPK